MTGLPLTDESIAWIARRINSLVIVAGTLPEMYRKLNVLRRNGSPGWRLLRSPIWRGGLLVAMVVKWDVEYAAELDAASTPPSERSGPEVR